MFQLKTEPIEDTKLIKGVPFPAWVKFGQILITGPPGSGKSTLITKIGGWWEEGYVDLGMDRWWTSRCLSIRPREIHLGFPFVGIPESLAVFDREWREADPPPELSLRRILIPPAKKSFFSVDWRERYVFEFVLPRPEELLERRLKRESQGTHHVDRDLTLGVVQNQVLVFQQAAEYLHRRGIQVYIREGTEGALLRIVSTEA